METVAVTPPPPLLVPASHTSSQNHKGREEFDASVSDEERRFYLKAYPNIDVVRDRKVHCTTCKCHIGTAPSQEDIIKMHPILRVTQCTKCHDFYNSGEFSKGEDGSELYCRWCGQGGEVYCCSSCPYVFCKSCIVKNLSRGVVADIEQNENWSCFNCSSKILWPLRAQHWALIKYIDKQRRAIKALNLPDAEERIQMAKDRSTCCRLAKAKCGNMSDSLESLESSASRRSVGSTNSAKRNLQKPPLTTSLKRLKTSNDEVVCTPDLLSMLEPDCQITMPGKPRPVQTPTASSPKIMSIQTNYGTSTQRSSLPPPLVLRNTSTQVRPIVPSPIVRRTVIGPRTPSPGGSTTPVYHTINGYRIDLNSAAQHETFRLPNGKLIQVKRQGAQQSPQNTNNWTQQRANISITQHNRPIQITPTVQQQQHYQTVTIQHNQQQQHQQTQQGHPPLIRYHNSAGGNSTGNISHNNTQIHMVNGTPVAPVQVAGSTAGTTTARPAMVRHVFPDTPIGMARTQLQEQVFNAMDICQHLTGKVQMLTNSNAYKQARNYLEVKELYIHLSYLLTYAIGRFKGLQDKCLGDMRQLGFVNDADSLENGQLAAGVDYVRYGQLSDVDLFNTGSNSFHNQVYEYRKSLLANLEDGDDGVKEPLSPLMPLGGCGDINAGDDDEDIENGSWARKKQLSNFERYDDDTTQQDFERDEPEENFIDSELRDESIMPDEDDSMYQPLSMGLVETSMRQGTEDYMNREEESHAYDRKLTRLIQQYPSIWCTRHPDYGNFEVTRKQWRAIASHFNRTESLNIKLRWKNIRKRYVRIERRMAEGKRFSGYYDKATNFLGNRDLPMEDWMKVDCGESDDDSYDHTALDNVEQTMSYEQQPLNTEFVNFEKSSPSAKPSKPPKKPIEINAIDMKIINFVKCNPVLWRKTTEPTSNKIDEQTRHSLWMHLWKSIPSIRCEEIVDRWHYLYEMYKAFRLKSIKDPNRMASLELKYSKYLAKLYFLYKIDEEDLVNESNILEDCGPMDDESSDEDTPKLQDMPDDKEFVLELARAVRQYPALWDKNHMDYHDIELRERYWSDIENTLKEFKRDVIAIKKRWQLAKFSLNCLRYQHKNKIPSFNMKIEKLYKNVPTDEMKFL